MAEGIAIEWQAKARIRKIENAFIVTVQMSSTIWLSFGHCAILQDYDLNNRSIDECDKNPNKDCVVLSLNNEIES